MRREQPSKFTLFTNVNIFDGTGSETFKGEVLVKDQRIVTVSKADNAIERGDFEVIDGGGAMLMPGLIDFHVHLALGSTVESMAKPGNYSDAESALIIAHCGRVMIDHGYTSGYSGGSASAIAEIVTGKAFDSGRLPGPRLVTSSIERVPGAAMGLNFTFKGLDTRPSNPKEVAAFVDEMADEGVDAVKFLLNGVSAFDAGTNMEEQFYDEEIMAAGEAARNKGVALTAHCYTAHSIHLAIKAGFRNLYHLTYADDAALDALEAHKDDVFVGPAPGIVEADYILAPKFGMMASDEQKAEQADAVERVKKMGTELRKRGIRSLPGGDYGFPWHKIGDNARDLELFVEWFGYTPAETLSAATQLGGEAMGMPDELGLIKEGYFADLLLVDGDASQNVSLLRSKDNLLAIMKDGRFHKAFTK